MLEKNTLITSVKKKHKPNYKYLTHGCLNLGEEIHEENILFNHPWDEKKKYLKDIKEIKRTYNYLIRKISFTLNNHFKIKKDVRYWTILLGPWLHIFIGTYFEKNILLCKLLKYKKNLNIPLVDYKIKDLVPDSYHTFLNLTLYSAAWQDYLFKTIALRKKFNKNFNLIKKKGKKNYEKKFVYSKFNLISYFKISLIKILGFIFYFRLKKQNLVFFDTYLTFKYNFLLILKNFSIPFFINEKKIENSFNYNLRKNLIKTCNIENKNYGDIFETTILNLPKDFLENYEQIKKKIFTSNIAKNPKVIFTSNGMYPSSYKTIYIAECVSNNSKLILAQHGGRYGNVKRFFELDHETEISDNFISWGKKKFHKKVVNFGTIKSIKEFRALRVNNSKNILFVMLSKGRFIRGVDSEINLKELYNYYNNICPKFYSGLENKLKKYLTFRSNQKVYWNENSFLLDTCKLAQLDSNRQKRKFLDVAKKSNIVVCSYLSTTFIELLIANSPVILFTPFSLESYNKETLKILKNLKKNKIFFNGPVEASRFINQNWKNIYKWWYDKKVQDSRKLFLKNFSIVNQNLFDDIQSLIEKNKK